MADYFYSMLFILTSKVAGTSEFKSTFIFKLGVTSSASILGPSKSCCNTPKEYIIILKLC